MAVLPTMLKLGATTVKSSNTHLEKFRCILYGYGGRALNVVAKILQCCHLLVNTVIGAGLAS